MCILAWSQITKYIIILLNAYFQISTCIFHEIISGEPSNGGSVRQRREAIIGRRRDFFDPDFGVKGNLKLTGSGKSKCMIDSSADSEIPELGLDSANLDVNCQLNPSRIANAAVKVASRLRNRSQRPRQQSSSHKKTRLSIEKEYENSNNDDGGEDSESPSAPSEKSESDASNDTDEDDSASRREAVTNEPSKLNYDNDGDDDY